jgi:hydroxyacylglutathione hydrolase
MATPIDFTAELEARALDVPWIHGAPSAERDSGPQIQVHAYDEHTIILRQSKSVHYEAPVRFVLFG